MFMCFSNVSKIICVLIQKILYFLVFFHILFGISTVAISCKISCQNLEISDVCINTQTKRKIKEGDSLL